MPVRLAQLRVKKKVDRTQKHFNLGYCPVFLSCFFFFCLFFFANEGIHVSPLNLSFHR
jgi:hypothetical protein